MPSVASVTHHRMHGGFHRRPSNRGQEQKKEADITAAVLADEAVEHSNLDLSLPVYRNIFDVMQAPWDDIEWDECCMDSIRMMHTGSVIKIVL